MDEVIKAYERFTTEGTKDGRILIYPEFYRDLDILLDIVKSLLVQEGWKE